MRFIVYGQLGKYLVAMAVAGGVALSAGLARGADPLGTNGEGVVTLSLSTQAVYKKISMGMVRVRAEPMVAALKQLGLLTPAQWKEFENWRAAQLAAGNGKRGDGADATMPADAGNNAGGMGRAQAGGGGRPIGGGVFLRRWLDTKLASNPDNDTTTRLKNVQTRLAALTAQVNEMMGVLVDGQGDVLVIGGQLKDMQPESVRVVGVDGSESTARFVGANQNKGFAIIKVDNPGSFSPVEMATDSPGSGELLLSMTARQGSLEWIVAPGHFAKKGVPERFAVAGGDGPTFLFNASGQLAALGFNQFALPIGAYKADVDWISKNGKDIQQRQLGMKYVPITPDVRRNSRALGNQIGVVVADVEAGSLAEKAGLQKNDIVIKIDRRPLWQMKDIQMDMATQSGSVPVDILRNDKEMTVDLPLQ